MYDFVCVCVCLNTFFFQFQMGKIHFFFFLPLIVERQTFLVDIFKYAIPLHKYVVILPKIGKIRTSLSGSNRKDKTTMENEKLAF